MQKKQIFSRKMQQFEDAEMMQKPKEAKIDAKIFNSQIPVINIYGNSLSSINFHVHEMSSFPSIH